MASTNSNPKKNNSIRAIDLFAGIGGIRLGFKQAYSGKDTIKDFGNEPDDNIRFVYANEIEPNACETYKANFHDDPMGDITKVDPLNEIPSFDLLLGGFPCQAFSIAGHKRGFDDTRGTLFFYIAEILRVKQPKAFLLENVKHLKTHDKGRTFQVIKDVLRIDLGYHIYYKVLNAKDFGVPQNRERIYIVGFKDNIKFEFPTPPKIEVSLNNILEPEGEVDPKFYLSHEYLSGLKKHRARHEAKGNGFGYEVRPRKGIANAIVCGGMGKERNLVYDNILENCWKKPTDDKQLRNEEGIRKMTPREWARLQGFPENFIFPVSMTRKYKLLGNSVAVPVIKAIASQMKIALEDYEILTENALGSSIKFEIHSLLMKFYERNAFTKSGKKNIASLERFITKNYLRISNLNFLLKSMKNFGILDNFNEKTIEFSDDFINIKSKVELKQKIEKYFTDIEEKSVLERYSQQKVIPLSSHGESD